LLLLFNTSDINNTQSYRASTISDPHERIMNVALSFLPQFYHEIIRGPQTKKGGKPYNPILGEQFIGKYVHEDLSDATQSSVSNIICEQTSHHPPISSCYIENSHCNLQIEATVAWKANFNITYMQFSTLGRTLIRLTNLDEEYVVKLPANVAQFGMLFGTPISYPYGEMTITCAKTGYSVIMDFQSEEKIKGKVRHNNTTVGKFKGSYQDMVYEAILDKKTANSKSKPATQQLFKLSKPDTRLVPITVPIAQQSNIESRKVWHECTKAMFANEYDKAAAAKHAVEESQRNKKKQAHHNKEPEWKPVHFEAVLNEICDNTQMYRYKGNNNKSSEQHLMTSEELALD